MILAKYVGFFGFFGFSGHNLFVSKALRAQGALSCSIYCILGTIYDIVMYINVVYTTYLYHMHEEIYLLDEWVC